MFTDIKDSKTRHIIKFAKKYNIKEQHFKSVSEYSLMLYQNLKSVHKLGKKEKLLLYHAALLHDIGYYISASSHHKNSLKIIVESKELKFKKKEKILLGLIARYHRKSFPKETHKYYPDLSDEDKNVVLKLSSILRIADGLDYRHLNIINSIESETNGNEIILIIASNYNAQIECAMGMKKSDLFEFVFDRKVSIINKIKFQARGK